VGPKGTWTRPLVGALLVRNMDPTPPPLTLLFLPPSLDTHALDGFQRRRHAELFWKDSIIGQRKGMLSGYGVGFGTISSQICWTGGVFERPRYFVWIAPERVVSASASFRPFRPFRSFRPRRSEPALRDSASKTCLSSLFTKLPSWSHSVGLTQSHLQHPSTMRKSLKNAWFFSPLVPMAGLMLVSDLA
jgi:hypothetical protein